MFIGKNQTSRYSYNARRPMFSRRINIIITPIVALFLLVALMLAACGAPDISGSQTASGGPDTKQGEQATSGGVQPSDGGSDTQQKKQVTSGKTISGIVAQVNDYGSFLLAGTSEFDVYIVSGKFTVTDSDGKKTDVDALRPGQRVDAILPKDGGIDTSLPARFSPEAVIITEDGDDMIGFYLTVLDEIWNVDPALNPSNGMLFFDIDDVYNLTAGEKSALIWMALSHFDAGYTQAKTSDQLVDEGYIDEKLLQFKDENSLLIEMSTSEEKENSFKFTVSKWVSGTGADWYDGCLAEKKDGKWSYTLGGYAIS